MNSLQFFEAAKRPGAKTFCRCEDRCEIFVSFYRHWYSLQRRTVCAQLYFDCMATAYVQSILDRVNNR